MSTYTVRFIDMTDADLRTAYTAERANLYNWSNLAQPRRQDGGKSANGTGRALRNVEMIEAIARRRGVQL